MALPPFLAAVEQNDPVLAKAIEPLYAAAMGSGALDQKTKALISMALDATHGAARGVESLSNQARRAGATEAEITETIRIAYVIAGMSTLLTGQNAFPRKE